MNARPPRVSILEYDENLERNVWNYPWKPDDFSCKFCPARAESPEEIEHSTRCPVFREGGGV